MAHRRAFGIALATLALSAGSSSLSAAKSVPIFECSFGAKRVRVVSVGPVLRYEFGRPSKPEIVLIGDPARGTVRYHRTPFPHAENKQLRFINGAHSYLLFSRFAAPDYWGSGTEDRSGLLVIRAGRTIARLNCRGPGDFSPTFNFDRLPDDGENAVPD